MISILCIDRYIFCRAVREKLRNALTKITKAPTTYVHNRSLQLVSKCAPLDYTKDKSHEGAYLAYDYQISKYDKLDLCNIIIFR